MNACFKIGGPGETQAFFMGNVNAWCKESTAGNPIAYPAYTAASPSAKDKQTVKFTFRRIFQKKL